MKKLFVLILSLTLSAFNVYAEEAETIEPVAVEENAVVTEENNVVTEENNVSETAINPEEISSEPEQQPELEIVHQVEKEVIPMPACDDDTLLKRSAEFIDAYFKSNDNAGTLYRRRRHFILHNLDKFQTENVANYKTAATSPVSDIIADIKTNRAVAEENMRLCKNISKDKYAGQIYLLIYPEEGGYRVHVINLLDKQTTNEEASFIYKE